MARYGRHSVVARVKHDTEWHAHSPHAGGAGGAGSAAGDGGSGGPDHPNHLNQPSPLPSADATEANRHRTFLMQHVGRLLAMLAEPTAGAGAAVAGEGEVGAEGAGAGIAALPPTGSVSGAALTALELCLEAFGAGPRGLAVRARAAGKGAGSITGAKDSFDVEVLSKWLHAGLEAGSPSAGVQRGGGGGGAGADGRGGGGGGRAAAWGDGVLPIARLSKRCLQAGVAEIDGRQTVSVQRCVHSGIYLYVFVLSL